MDKYDLNDLYYFALISKSRGLSAAARDFGIPKTTLTRSLKRLEVAAGFPLFDRHGRGLRLSPSGEHLAAEAEACVDILAKAEKGLRMGASEPSGALRIAASALSGQSLLAPVIAKFCEKYPKVKVYFTVSSFGLSPITSDLDLVIQVGRSDSPHLVSKKLIASHLSLYASSALAEILDLEDPVAVSSLGRVAINVPDFPKIWRLAEDDGRMVELGSEPVIEVQDPMIALGILEAGSGLGFLPTVFPEHLSTSTKLKRVLSTYKGPLIELFAVLAPNRSKVPAVKVFLKYVESYLADLPAEN